MTFQTNTIFNWDVEDTITDPQEELNYAKTGIFRTIGCTESALLMSQGTLPKLYWEWQRFPSIGKDGVYAVKSERYAKYRGSKKQHKHLIYKVQQSALVLSRHALERFYQRSHTPTQKPDFFYHNAKDWIGNAQLGSELVEQGMIRSDYPLPFGRGAFLGEIIYMPCGGDLESYEFDDFGKCIKSPRSAMYRPTFFAHTYILDSMMSDQQFNICTLIRGKNFTEAREEILNSKVYNCRTFNQVINVNHDTGDITVRRVGATHASND